MQALSYRTIKSNTVGIYKEKGSKFLAFAYPVDSENAIKERLQALKKEYFDARHHCYAWMLGADKKHFRTSDDGEPNHSAGDPILGQIRSHNLTDVLIVVVRYFGGIKLGVGGLISAYKTAAEDALNNSVTIEREVVEKGNLQYDYATTPEVMRLVKEFNLVITHQDFGDNCSMDFEIALRDAVALKESVTLLNAMGRQILQSVRNSENPSLLS